MHQRPLIAIVGRPNTGKSTLFNRLIGQRRAMVHEQPGMTRDRHYADAEYRMRPFTVIDTGGYEDETASTLLQQMRTQSILAMEEADRIIFLASVNEPNDPVDMEILERLRASGKPFHLAVNKCEGGMREAQAYADFSVFGLDEIHPISALHGEGVFDLMDVVTDSFEEWDPDDEPEEDRPLHVAIVGRQNVGKSTLLNKLLGEERVIANPVGGTTRDAIDARVKVDGKEYIVIDTAGIRRRGRIERGPEKLSVHSSFRAIDRAQVAILVLDATDGITAQDQHIAGYILERKKACVILLNKWDLIDKKDDAYGKAIKMLRHEYRFMPWAPIVTGSALSGQRTHKLWPLIDKCATNYRKQFPTSRLNLILKKATAYVSPPTRKGTTLTIKYVTQTRSQPPTLSLFVNDPKLVHFSYERFLHNQFYMQLGLEGTPLILRFRRKAPPRGWEKAVRMQYREDNPSSRRAEDLPEDEVVRAGIYTDEGEIIEQPEALEIAFDEEEDFGEWPEDDGEDDE